MQSRITVLCAALGMCSLFAAGCRFQSGSSSASFSQTASNDKVRFTFGTADLTAKQSEESDETSKEIETILSKRVKSLKGGGLPTIRVEPDLSKVVVEIENCKDPAALAVLTSNHVFAVYHAKNVQTVANRYAKYVDLIRKGTETEVWFTTRNAKPSDSPIKPTDPAYAEMIKGWDIVLAGNDVATAAPSALANGKVQPQFTFTKEGARKMELWSRSVLNQGAKLAFVLDGKVISIAPLKDDVILTDNAFIDGDFEESFVTQMCADLNAGVLPVRLIPRETELIKGTRP
ncbi:MAG: hypothetical protein JST40_09510 [Armatimonadetes bacterium]|nr:hypothetical protein [Armatimonadota bacterium]